MSKSANSVIELNKMEFDSTNNRINFVVPISTNNQTIADQISSTSSQANAAFNQANAAFASANNVAPQIQPAFNTANAAYNRANNSLNANTGGTVTGDIITTGIIRSAQSIADEGGQIELSKPVSNTSLSGNVTIDVYQNKVRIFDGAGTNRGVFIDIANTTANGVGSEVTKYDSNSSSTGFISVPTGTTAQRPSNPKNGSIRYNTTTQILEVYIDGWKTLASANYDVTVLAVGGGGGGGGYDGGQAGRGGGSGGVVEGTITLSPGTSLQVAVGGGGGGAASDGGGVPGGTGGSNGGGPGGASGGSPSSGGGGGGGGWTGVYSGSFYYVIAGGGAGGGGATEGIANDVDAAGGGVQNNGTNGTNLVGGTGAQYGGDGGGFGGGGGGRYGGAGQNTGNGQSSGGGNFTEGVVTGVVLTNGNPSSGGTGGASRSYTFTGYTQNAGAGGNAATAGSAGIVIIRYPGAPRGTGGTITSAGGFTFHTFTANGVFTS